MARLHHLGHLGRRPTLHPDPRNSATRAPTASPSTPHKLAGVRSMIQDSTGILPPLQYSTTPPTGDPNNNNSPRSSMPMATRMQITTVYLVSSQHLILDTCTESSPTLKNTIIVVMCTQNVQWPFQLCHWTKCYESFEHVFKCFIFPSACLFI